MKQTLLTLALLAASPLLTGCEIRQSYGYIKNRPCGCHGPKHHDHCSYGQKHRPPRNGSHDPHIPPRPDRGHDFYSPRAASSEINTLDHRSFANRTINPRPAFTPKPPRAKAVTNSSANRAIRSDSRPTKANQAKSSKNRRP